MTALVVTACGPSFELEPPPPSAIPQLEVDVEGDSTDTNALADLAVAYRTADRSVDARVLLERGRALNPDDQAIPVLLGLTYEDLGEFGLARSVYGEVLSQGGVSLEDVVRDRLDIMATEELRESVRDALARESELSSLPPTPNTVGVFPFQVEGDPDLEPLSRVMAEFLVTDLSIVGRLQVLERVRVQTLLTEIALGEGGWTEPETAARAGRLLSAERIVQGRIDAAGSGLRIDAAVVRIGDTPAAGDPVVSTGAVETLFDMEKELALGLYAEMGVSLTPAERARINEMPTESVQALLAYGRGLEASDRGDLATASQEFAEAASFDPDFQMAQLQLQSTSRSAAARRRSSPQAARRAAQLNRARQAVRRIRRNPAGLRPAALKNLTDRQRAVLSEVLGQDRLGKLFLLEIVFRPGG
jgi:TolB-like protein